MLRNIFFLKQEKTHLQYVSLAVAFGRYAYAANKFTLSADSFYKSSKNIKRRRKRVNNPAFVYWMISWGGGGGGKESLTIYDFSSLTWQSLDFPIFFGRPDNFAGYFYICYVKRK